MEGNAQEKLDVSHMFWELKQHGVHLNHIQDGIQSAVDERMKSDAAMPIHAFHKIGTEREMAQNAFLNPRNALLNARHKIVVFHMQYNAGFNNQGFFGKWKLWDRQDYFVQAEAAVL